MAITQLKKSARKIKPHRAMVAIDPALHVELADFCGSRKPIRWSLYLVVQLAIREYIDRNSGELVK